MSIRTEAMEGKTPTPAVLAEAEHWFARLKAADCLASERMEFQRWKAVDGNALAYEETERLWRSFEDLKGRTDLTRLSEKVLLETQPRRGWGMYAAAASVIVCVLGAAAFFAIRGQLPDVYTTVPGERSTITLADNSRVILNSATELAVRIDNDRRSFTLRKGEALFVVASDPRRPFTVSAGDGEVTALGTRFQVRNETRRVTVTLLEGSVAVDRSDLEEHVRLKPGDQVRYTADTAQMTRRTVDPEMVSSWSTGRLRFRYTPLAEALEEVNRYSSVQISLGEEALGSIPISGTFEVGDSLSVISAIEALLPIDAHKRSDREYRLVRR